eukprot:CAMPEP_0117784250 /NCGR_PEP_ID=MMETSP0948-20121206/4544_1 /TAXON_ID=44440 /ORGANISM="Chattonella subsalsa, Strain CCMP2191" /LENGTH=217 /DNA_ID=CAMNT_0005612865 /DNA_START=37 /DNA_END=691 /DNA_ORIENTATION=-
MSRYGSSNYGPGQGPPDISGMHTLKVDNISYRCGVEELRRLFDRYGDIGDVYIPRDIRTNESRGFGFVRFFDRRDAEDAMDAMDREVVDGRELRVQFAERDAPETLGSTSLTDTVVRLPAAEGDGMMTMATTIGAVEGGATTIMTPTIAEEGAAVAPATVPDAPAPVPDHPKGATPLPGRGRGHVRPATLAHPASGGEDIPEAAATRLGSRPRRDVI